MKNLFDKLNRRTTVGGAAFLISFSYLISRLLGLLRDRLLAAHFGIGPVVDAYTAAFRLPELLFTLLVSGALAVAFIPVLSDHLVASQRDEAWEVSSILLNFLAVTTLALTALIFILADPLTSLIAPGFDSARHELTVNLTRIMLATPFLFAVSSVFGSIQQAFGRFLFFASASIFYNLGIIFGIIYLEEYGIYGVAMGVVIGAVAQALVQLLGMLGLDFRYHWSLNLRNPSIRRVLRLILPRSIDQGVDQLNYTVETIIGSHLRTGSLTAYYYANNLKNVPLALFGSAIATAAFPKLAADAAAGRRDKLIEDLVYNLRLILFLVIPSATLAVLLRGYIVRLLFGFGDPTTAQTLGWFAGVILFQSLFYLIARVFYALKDTRTPLYASLVTIALNIILSLILSRRYGVVGLAMSQSLAAAFEVILLSVILKRRLGSIGGRSLLAGAVRMLLANSIMGSLVYILVARLLPLYRSDIGFSIVAPKFGTIMLAAALTYLVPCYLLNLREARQVFGRFKAIMQRPINLPWPFQSGL